MCVCVCYNSSVRELLLYRGLTLNSMGSCSKSFVVSGNKNSAFLCLSGFTRASVLELYTVTCVCGVCVCVRCVCVCVCMCVCV